MKRCPTCSRVETDEIMPADPAGINNPPHVLLTPDGKSYVYTINR